MRILFPAVLFPGGDAAADVSLGLVHLQDFLHLLVQHPIELGQPFGDVLCTVDLLMPNFCAAARTVVRFSMMY